jgi:hypothetical protein
MERAMSITPEDLAALPIPGTRQELLERMPPARAALEASLAPLSEVQLTRPGPDRWSVADHLLHLALWQEMIVAHLHDRTDHAVAGLDADAFADLGLEELNEHLYERTRRLPLAEALSRFRESYGATVAFLRDLPEATFAERYWPDDPRPVMAKITGDTYRHDLEHREWIEALVARLEFYRPSRRLRSEPGPLYQ